MTVAYWEHPVTKEQPAYIFYFTAVEKGRKGYAEYQSTMYQIGEVNRMLSKEGYKLKYRKDDEEGTNNS